VKAGLKALDGGGQQQLQPAIERRDLLGSARPSTDHRGISAWQRRDDAED
jgi:hypothetical protein